LSIAGSSLAADSVDVVPGQKKGGLFYWNVAVNSIAGAVFLQALSQGGGVSFDAWCR